MRAPLIVLSTLLSGCLNGSGRLEERSLPLQDHRG